MKMRKIFNLAMVAMVTLGVVSCSKDSPIDGGVNGGTPGTKLSFNFEGINDGITSYSVTAEDFEKEVNDATVYIFEYKNDKSGELLLVQNEDFSLTSNYLVVIEDDANVLLNKRLVAYFTINNGSSFDTYADLTSFTAGSGKTETDFANVATDAIIGKVSRTNFLMTSAITGTDNFPNYGEYPTTVKRRVARFDIVNETPAAIVSVNKVTVRSAANLSNVFGEATVAASPTAIATDVVYDLKASEYGVDGTDLLDWEASVTPIGQDIETANSVFYLNPTELVKDIPTDGTQIFVEATVGTETEVFELELTDDVEILANYRYILTLTSDLRFRITVADWDTNGDEIIDTKPVDTSLRLVADPLGSAIDSYANHVIVLNGNAGTVNFAVTAASTAGTSFTLTADENYTDHSGLIQVTEVPSSTVTYSSPYFASTYTIAVDALPVGESSVTMLTIRDKYNVDNKLNIRLVYNATGLPVTPQPLANTYMLNANNLPLEFCIPLEQARLGWQYVGSAQKLEDFVAGDNWEIATLWRTWQANGNITGSKTVNLSGGLEDNHATLTFDKGITNGNNAVVVLRDKISREIYWSWQLWFTSYNPNAVDNPTGTKVNVAGGEIHQYFGDAFTTGALKDKYMMDRNLGAVCEATITAQPQTTEASAKTYGMMYQWGRKDPFTPTSDGWITAAKIYDANGVLLTADKDGFPKVAVDGSNNKVAEAISNPMNYYVNNSIEPGPGVDPEGNWTLKDDDLWGENSNKSVFDPCPAGWRIPIKGTEVSYSPWAGFSNNAPSTLELVTNEEDAGKDVFETYKNIQFGMWEWETLDGTGGRVYDKNGVKSWYPFTGYRYFGNGGLRGVGYSGYSWTASVKDVKAHDFSYSEGAVTPQGYDPRANAYPVRCVQE